MPTQTGDFLAKIGAMHARSIARKNIGTVPDIANAEALELAAYIATIPGSEVGGHWDAIWRALAIAGKVDPALSLIARAYQLGYLAALDDIQTEKVAV